MSGENILEQIAEDLRNQTPTPVEQTPAEPTPVETTEEENPPANAVNDQITDSVTEPAPNQKEWWEEDKKDVDVNVTQDNQKPQEPNEPVFDLDDDIKLLVEYKKVLASRT